MRKCAFTVLLKMKNRFDYKEYCGCCDLDNCEPETAQVFARIAGSLTTAEIMFSDVPLEQAFMLFQNLPVNAVNVTQSKGLGDTVAKVTHVTGLVKLAELYTKITGKPCGCASRQEALNKLFPYGITEE